MVPQHLIVCPKPRCFDLPKADGPRAFAYFCSTHVYIFVLAVPRCKDLPLLSLLIFTTRLFPPSCWFWICSSDVTNDVALTWRNIHIQTASAWQAIGLKSWLSGFGTDHRALGPYIYIQKYECTYKKNLMYGIFKRFSVFEWLT